MLGRSIHIAVFCLCIFAVDNTTHAAVITGLDSTAHIVRAKPSGQLRAVRANDLAPDVSSNKFDAYMNANAAHYGLNAPHEQLQQVSNAVTPGGLRTQTYRQFHEGIPVFGAMLRANYSSDGQLHTVNGALVENIAVESQPTLTAREAEQRAQAALTRHLAPRHYGTLQLNSAQTQLLVYQIGLERGLAGRIHLVYDVTLTDNQRINQAVMIDAHTGALVAQRSLNAHLIDRVIFFPTPDTLAWSEGDPLFNDDPPVLDNMINVAQDTYNFFSSVSGGTYLSWDGNDVTMRGLLLMFGALAQWNPTEQLILVGSANSVDDVIAHEWAHAYTDGTHNLLTQQWEPGAINEAFSDIWGETIDQLNGSGLDTDSPRDAECLSPGENVRWILSEDAPTSAASVGVRDMWNPNCEDNPGKMSDPEFFCGLGIGSTFVSTNSGIVSHAYALLVDGGSFNNQTIESIGVAKAAAIYWRAQSAYQTPFTGYAAHADALEMACEDLMVSGDVFEPSTLEGVTASVGQTTSADCAAVSAAIDAVELRTPNPCTLPDTDGDGYPDTADNCLLIANPSQRNTNATEPDDALEDRFGNLCDPDLNNDGIVNIEDLGLLRAVFFNPGPDQDADLDGDGVVNFVDLGIMRSFFFMPPGPTGLPE